jgi:hypothetical protein
VTFLTACAARRSYGSVLDGIGNGIIDSTVQAGQNFETIAKSTWHSISGIF